MIHGVQVRIVDVPHPSRGTETWVTSLEPWQREGLLRLREVLGVDADALLRAGVTVVLSIVAATADAAAPPTHPVEGAPDPNPVRSKVTRSIPGDPPPRKPGNGASS